MPRYYDGPRFESNGKLYKELPLNGMFKCAHKDGVVTIEYHDGRVQKWTVLPIPD
jgi:hypothetical protein